MFKKINFGLITSSLILIPVSLIATTSIASRNTNGDFMFKGYRFSSYEDAIQFAIRNNIFDIRTKKKIGSYNHFLTTNGYNSLDERFFKDYIPSNIRYAFVGADSGRHYKTREAAIESYLGHLQWGFRHATQGFTMSEASARASFSNNFKNVVLPAIEMNGQYFNIYNKFDRQEMFKKQISNWIDKGYKLDLLLNKMGIKTSDILSKDLNVKNKMNGNFKFDMTGIKTNFPNNEGGKMLDITHARNFNINFGKTKQSFSASIKNNKLNLISEVGKGQDKQLETIDSLSQAKFYPSPNGKEYNFNINIKIKNEIIDKTKYQIKWYLKKKYGINKNKNKKIEELLKNTVNYISNQKIFSFRYTFGGPDGDGYTFRAAEHGQYEPSNTLIWIIQKINPKFNSWSIPELFKLKMNGINYNINTKEIDNLLNTKYLKSSKKILLRAKETELFNKINDSEIWTDQTNDEFMKVRFDFVNKKAFYNNTQINIKEPDKGYTIDSSAKTPLELMIQYKAFDLKNKYGKSKERILYLNHEFLKNMDILSSNNKLTPYQVLKLQSKDVNPILSSGLYDSISNTLKNRTRLETYKKYLSNFVERLYKYGKFNATSSSLSVLKHKIMQEIYSSNKKKVYIDPNHIFYQWGEDLIPLDANIFDAYGVHIEGSMMQTMYFKSYSDLNTFLLDYIKNNATAI